MMENSSTVEMHTLPEYGIESNELLVLLKAAASFDEVDRLVMEKQEGMAPDELSRRAEAVLSGVDVQSFKALQIMDAFIERMRMSGCCTEDQLSTWLDRNSDDRDKNHEECDDEEDDDGHGHIKGNIGSNYKRQLLNKHISNESNNSDVNRSIVRLILKYFISTNKLTN